MSKKNQAAAEQIAQADHGAVTPAALLARIMDLEDKAGAVKEKPVKAEKK